MPVIRENREHDVTTQRSGYRYLFTVKHHGGDKYAGQWRLEMTFAQEFSIFDLADLHDLADDRGRLYGVWRDADGELLDLGTWGEQVAEFQTGGEDQPWHGYPKWAINEEGPKNRQQEKLRPGRAVFNRMVAVGLITYSQRQRLLKGDHA
jgi:hypothetical protein